MKDEDLVQGSPEWHNARRKFDVTGSVLSEMMGISPYTSQAMALDYFEGKKKRFFNHFVQRAMAHGTEYESDARMIYEEATGNKVIEKGLYSYSEDRRFAASPDGVIFDKISGKRIGMIEIKCPFSAYRHAGLKNGRKPDAVQNAREKVPLDYIPQIFANMKFMGVEWCDYVSYVPGGDCMAIHRIYYNEATWKYIYDEVCKFLDHPEIIRKKKKCDRSFKEAILLMKVRKSNPILDILIRTKNIKKISNK
ncbi:hypothetical protein ACTFIY_004564 [Dictyostelium cf. discoideum]